MREYKRIFNDDNVNEERVEIKAKKLVNKASEYDSYDLNDKDIFFSDIDNSYNQDKMYGKYDTKSAAVKKVDADYIPPFSAGEIDKNIPEENTTAESSDNTPDDLEYIDSDAIRFNDISNSQQSADALNIEDNREGAGYIPLNEEVKQAVKLDSDRNDGKYFIDKEITLSKKESDDADKEDKIHLLSELDGPDDSDIDNIYQEDLTEEDYDEDAIIFTDIENDENGNSLIYDYPDEEESYDEESFELDNDYDNEDEPYESEEDYDDLSEYPELDDNDFYDNEKDSQEIFEDLGDDFDEQGEFEDNIAESNEDIDTDLDTEGEFQEFIDSEEDDEEEYFIDDLSSEDEEEHLSDEEEYEDDQSIDNDNYPVGEDDEDLLIDNLDLANDRGDDDSFSSLDLEDDIDNQNDLYKSEPGKPRGKRNAVILVIVCVIAVVLGFGLYFLINYFSNNDFKGFSNLFSAENAIEEDIDMRV